VEKALVVTIFHLVVKSSLDRPNRHSRQLISSAVPLSRQSLWPSQTKAALMQRPLAQVNSVAGLHVGKGQPRSSLLSPQSSVKSQASLTSTQRPLSQVKSTAEQVWNAEQEKQQRAGMFTDCSAFLIVSILELFLMCCTVTLSALKGTL